MATLKNQRGEPLLDADGQEIKEGSVVVDDMTHVWRGRCARTVPLDHGDGRQRAHHVAWPSARSKATAKPQRREPEASTRRLPGGRMRTTSFTAGTDFESGAAHRAQGVNDAEAQ